MMFPVIAVHLSFVPPSGHLLTFPLPPCLFCNLVCLTDCEITTTLVQIYFPVESYEVLRRALDERLQEYNESNAEMNLELFDDAMEHVCRISRILSYPRGNALLVGVGGSGKQSLARLASFIWGYDVHSIVVRAGYSMSDFRADVQLMYRKVRPPSPAFFSCILVGWMDCAA